MKIVGRRAWPWINRDVACFSGTRRKQWIPGVPKWGRPDKTLLLFLPILVFIEHEHFKLVGLFSIARLYQGKEFDSSSLIYLLVCVLVVRGGVTPRTDQLCWRGRCLSASSTPSLI